MRTGFMNERGIVQCSSKRVEKTTKVTGRRRRAAPDPGTRSPIQLRRRGFCNQGNVIRGSEALGMPTNGLPSRKANWGGKPQDAINGPPSRKKAKIPKPGNRCNPKIAPNESGLPCRDAVDGTTPVAGGALLTDSNTASLLCSVHTSHQPVTTGVTAYLSLLSREQSRD